MKLPIRYDRRNADNIIYFDNAATSFPKPARVINAVNECILRCGNPGRGSHKLSFAAAEVIYKCRTSIAEMFGGMPENTFLTYNATYALNTAIKSFLPRGANVLISDIEHNSVYRPVFAAAQRGELSFDIFGSFGGDEKRIIADLERLFTADTAAVICTQASNICGITLPIKAIGDFCERHSLLFILDASQSAGHTDIDLDENNISVLCAPAHKGLYGIQGLGFFIVRELPDGARAFLEGGNGVNSLEAEMPEFLPERYEAGTNATPVAAALAEGIAFVNEIGAENIGIYEKFLFSRARDIIDNFPDMSVLARDAAGGTLSFVSKAYSSEKIGVMLNDKGICVRTGYHCSPLGHKTLGSIDSGSVRMSFGAFNTVDELDIFYKALKEIYI